MSDVINAPQGATPGATAESLQVQLVDEQAAHQATQAELEAERASHQATKGELATVSASLSQATEVITGQKETISTLATRVTELESKPSSFPSFELNKKKYEVQAKKFKYKGQDYTVADLLSDKQLQKELVGKRIGFIVEKTV